jgi:hypothetical protein
VQKGGREKFLTLRGICAILKIPLGAISSVGQSYRLITGWSGVQVPDGPPKKRRFSKEDRRFFLFFSLFSHIVVLGEKERKAVNFYIQNKKEARKNH